MEISSYAFEGRKYLRAYDRLTRRIYKPLTTRSLLAPLGRKKIDELLEQVRWEFSLLILQIPFIGRKNIFKPRLVFSTLSLAFWRVLKHYGWKTEEISRFLNQMVVYFAETIPSFMRRMLHRHLFSPGHIRSVLQGALSSQFRKYDGDWVYKFVPGDEDFSYGMDVYHCAIDHFYHNQGATELLPFMCELECKAANLLDLKLVNTERLPDGAGCCNCRLIRQRALPID